MMDDIKTYKLLILECNFLKTCISKYHSIQVMKKNSPICKICYTNVSDHVTIPCGHLVCKKCIILTKTFAAQNVGIGTQNFNFSTSEPITYSITVFNNPNQNINSESSNITNIPSILPQNLNNTATNDNNIATQTDTTNTLSNIFNFDTNNINTNNNAGTNTTNTTNANTNANANANANANVNTNNENNFQQRQRLTERRERYVRRNSENRERERRSSILPRRILRRNSSPRKDKCPFCRQEIENTYRIYY
jgi:hypothetical protein